MIIDLHCHLDLYPDPYKVVERCLQDKIYVLSVTTTPKAWKKTSSFEKSFGRIKTALGLHPQLAHLRMDELELFDSLIPLTKYVGEIGLDGSKEYRPFLKKQLSVFKHILKSSEKNGGRIMSIHSRASATLILDELEKSPDSGIPVFHWFSGTKNELDRAVKLGCWFSVGPAMISSKKGSAISALMPRNRILTETDGPFGSLKGKKLMPWDAIEVIPKLAEIWGVDSLEAEGTVGQNFKELVGAA